MKVFFQRLDKDRNVCNMAGELDSTYSNGGQVFTFYFDTPAKGVILNDGNPYDLRLLEGVVTRWWMDKEGFYIHGFLQIDNRWHEEGMHFRFKPLPAN